MNNNNVFLFAGQGSQFVGMGEDFFSASTKAKRVFETADSVIGRSISKLCFEGPLDSLNLTTNTQPCILATVLAIAEFLKDKGIIPSCVSGFSLGEYAALVEAGVITLEEGFYLINIRAKAMQEAVPVGTGSMAAVKKCPSEVLATLCKEVGNVWPVNFNSPNQIVISGLTEQVDTVVQELKKLSYRAVILPVSAPFHTPLMKSAKTILSQEFKNIKFKNAKIPIFMNFDGLPTIDKNQIQEKLLNQTTHPVKWTTILTNLNLDINNVYYEVGPGRTLSSFLSQTIQKEALSVNSLESLKEVCSCD